MTRNSEFGLTGIDTAATRETLKGGLARTLGANSIKAMFAGDGRNQALGRASIISLVVFVVGAAFTCAAQIVTARIIGPDSYGVYAYVLAWVTLLGYSSTLGFHVSLLRFVPAPTSGWRWARKPGRISWRARCWPNKSIAPAPFSQAIPIIAGDRPLQGIEIRPTNAPEA